MYLTYFYRYHTTVPAQCAKLCCKFNFLAATSFSALQHVVCATVNRDVYANSLRAAPYLLKHPTPLSTLLLVFHQVRLQVSGHFYAKRLLNLQLDDGSAQVDATRVWLEARPKAALTHPGAGGPTMHRGVINYRQPDDIIAPTAAAAHTHKHTHI